MTVLFTTLKWYDFHSHRIAWVWNFNYFNGAHIHFYHVLNNCTLCYNWFERTEHRHELTFVNILKKLDFSLKSNTFTIVFRESWPTLSMLGTLIWFILVIRSIKIYIKRIKINDMLMYPLKYILLLYTRIS